MRYLQQMSSLVNYRRTSHKPRRPFEKERLDGELKLVGEYGLKNKREVWRTRLALSKIRTKARILLTLPETDEKRIFEGEALIRRLHRYGILATEKDKLDHVLGLRIEDFMERRLQTKVFQQGLARSIHHARVLIKQRHIRVGNQMVDIPSFVVRTDSEKHIDFAIPSPFSGQSRPGRVRRKKDRERANKDKEGGGEANEDDAAQDE